MKFISEFLRQRVRGAQESEFQDYQAYLDSLKKEVDRQLTTHLERVGPPAPTCSHPRGFFPQSGACKVCGEVPPSVAP